MARYPRLAMFYSLRKRASRERRSPRSPALAARCVPREELCPSRSPAVMDSDIRGVARRRHPLRVWRPAGHATPAATARGRARPGPFRIDPSSLRAPQGRWRDRLGSCTYTIALAGPSGDFVRPRASIRKPAAKLCRALPHTWRRIWPGSCAPRKHCRPAACRRIGPERGRGKCRAGDLADIDHLQLAVFLGNRELDRPAALTIEPGSTSPPTRSRFATASCMRGAAPQW